MIVLRRCTKTIVFTFLLHPFWNHSKQPIRCQGSFKVINQIAGKWKTKSIMWQILQLFFPKLLLPPPPHPPKWMNLVSDRLSNTLIKYSTWSSPVFERFQNRCNKVVIEPRVVQLWSEIILVISNRTHAARSFDFKITHNFSPNCTQFTPITIIKLGVESNPTSLCDWSWELPPFSQPIRRRTKTNHEMVVRVFPAL